MVAAGASPPNPTNLRSTRRRAVRLVAAVSTDPSHAPVNGQFVPAADTGLASKRVNSNFQESVAPKPPGSKATDCEAWVYVNTNRVTARLCESGSVGPLGNPHATATPAASDRVKRPIAFVCDAQQLQQVIAAGTVDKHQFAVNTPVRIIDVSLNRAGEGLRVVEDFARFVLDDRFLTRELKSLRHDLADAAEAAVASADRHAARPDNGRPPVSLQWRFRTDDPQAQELT